VRSSNLTASVRFSCINTLLQFKEGQGLRQVSAHLEEENLIRSRFVFEFLIMVIGGEESVAYGEYYFERATQMPSLLAKANCRAGFQCDLQEELLFLKAIHDT
jgi:cell division protein YceG involved in septum cleavage